MNRIKIRDLGSWIRILKIRFRLQTGQKSYQGSINLWGSISKISIINNKHNMIVFFVVSRES